MTRDVQSMSQNNLSVTGWNRAEKTITFAGGTTNATGDHDGTGDPFSIFTVTGTVIAKIVGICSTSIVGAGTIEVGIAGNTAGLLAQVADAEDIDAGDIWHDATVDKGIELSSVLLENIIANGADIIGTVGTANMTAGVIKFICLWKPLSADGDLVAA